VSGFSRTCAGFSRTCADFSRTCAGFSALLTLLTLVSGLSAQKQDDAADTTRLIEVLGLREGVDVADIGAGSGELTIRIARHVGSAGRVFSTDINPQRLVEIRDAVTQGQLRNVIVVEGASSQTNLPLECCDAIFMRHVYHHLGDPLLMNASLRASLKPGGRLAIVDFPPDNGVSAPAGRRGTDVSHGVMPETVMDELRTAGLVGVERLSWPSAGYFLIVARRPD
jgi:ubiquinone/menaquinone biosynthesis C-methylase UbiE